MTYSVYIAVNIANGKRYIGVTGKGVARRAKKHWEVARCGGNQCPKFHAALRKYGPDSFVWKTLFSTEDMTAAYAKEAELVASMTPEYNSVAGGRGPAGWNRRPVLCLEDGKVHPSATDAADFYGADVSEICKVVRGERRCSVGKHFCFADTPPISNSEAIKAIDLRFVVARKRVSVPKMRHAGIKDGKDSKGRSAAGPMSNARKIVCVDDGKVFDSIADAARFYEIDAGALSQLCAGKQFRKTVGGKVFRYLEASH